MKWFTVADFCKLEVMFTTTEENEAAFSLFSTYLDFIVALRLLQIFGGYCSDGGNGGSGGSGGGKDCGQW